MELNVPNLYIDCVFLWRITSRVAVVRWLDQCACGRVCGGGRYVCFVNAASDVPWVEYLSYNTSYIYILK